MRGPGTSGAVSHPVGQKYGNRFGLYDTIGNVWEWCRDWMAPHVMNLDTPEDPRAPATWQDVAEFLAKAKKWKGAVAVSKGKRSIGKERFYQRGRCLKGGAYDAIFGYFYFTCCQFRGALAPEKSDAAVGFRVAARQ